MRSADEKHLELAPYVRALLDLVALLKGKREAGERELATRRGAEALPATRAVEELRWAAHELNVDLPPDVGPLVAPLFGGREG